MIHIFIRKSKRLFINTAIRLLERFVKKDYHLWLFSMEGGRRFSGNILYFLEFVKEEARGIRTICIAEKDYVKERIEKLGGKTCRTNSLQSLYYALKAGVCIFSHEMASDLNNFSKRGSVKINLWHGVPLKRFQYSSEKLRLRIRNRSIWVKIREKLGGYVRHEEYDFIAYTSPNLANIMIEAFNNKNIYLTGDPRDDIFFRRIKREDILEKYGLKELAGKKIVTYLPTFRDVRRTDEDYLLFADHPTAAETLARLNAVLLQKNHTPTTDKVVRLNRRFILPDEVEPQELLYVSDVLITDYSSCYFDFLHTLRPIIFYAYDLEDYIREDRELNYDYFNELTTPGLKAFTEDQVLERIGQYLADPSLDLRKREAALAYFHQYSDGNSSRRVYESIQTILNAKGIPAFSIMRDAVPELTSVSYEQDTESDS